MGEMNHANKGGGRCAQTAIMAETASIEFLHFLYFSLHLFRLPWLRQRCHHPGHLGCIWAVELLVRNRVYRRSRPSEQLATSSAPPPLPPVLGPNSPVLHVCSIEVTLGTCDSSRQMAYLSTPFGAYTSSEFSKKQKGAVVPNPFTSAELRTVYLDYICCLLVNRVRNRVGLCHEVTYVTRGTNAGDCVGGQDAASSSRGLCLCRLVPQRGSCTSNRRPPCAFFAKPCQPHVEGLLWP